MGHRWHTTFALCAAFAWITLAGGCGGIAHDVDVEAFADGGASDDDDSKKDAGRDAATSSPDAATPQAGMGGQPPPPPPPPTCDPCGPGMGNLGTLAPCCTAEGRCGVDLTMQVGQPLCLEQSAPGGDSPVCPDVPITGFTIPGCCTRAGTCGVIITMTAPLGCVDLAPYGGIGALGIAGMTPGLPAPSIPCAERPQ